MADIHKAIRAIHNNVVTIDGDGELAQAWDDNGNLVTINWSQVNAWTDPNEYKFNRQQAYASIAEQLDMQYWDSVNGTTTWKDHISLVKTAHPKPTE